MVKKREDDYDYKSGPDQKLTYQDYLKMPWPPGRRYEILDGILFEESAPKTALAIGTLKLPGNIAYQLIIPDQPYKTNRTRHLTGPSII